MSPSKNIEQSKDYWSECELIYFTDSKAWGVDEDGSTWCLGREPDVLRSMETGELPDYLTLKERQTLSSTLQLRKEILSNEPKEYTPRDSVRGRSTRTFKRRQANIRQTPKRRALALYKIR